jgi:hypothetical protein
MSLSSINVGVGLAAGAALVAILYRRQIAQAATDAAQAINPVNPDNIFAQGANAAVSAVAGKQTTIGGELYDLTHDENGVQWYDPRDWPGYLLDSLIL